MSRLTGGQLAVRSLEAHGVTDLFGVPGVQNDWFYNAIFDEGQPFNVFTARHEQGAAYMALGYAASSGRTGVMSVVPGPGLLNASAALATAWSMCAPVLALVGQIASDRIDQGHGYLHEIVNQPSVVAPFTRWRGRATDPQQVSPLIAAAFRDVRTGDPRPAFLEVPLDVFRAEIDAEVVDPLPMEQPKPDPADIAQAIEVLAAARCPMIVAGSGALDASEHVRRLAELLGAPVVMHRGGQGILPADHSLAVPFPVGRSLWADVDVVVSIGSRLQMQLSEWGIDDQLTQLWINADPGAASRIGPPNVGSDVSPDVGPEVSLEVSPEVSLDVSPEVSLDVSIVARAEEVLPLIVDGLRGRELSSLMSPADIGARKHAHRQSIAELEPQLSYLSAIRGAIGDDGILVTDLTQVGYVSRLALQANRPRTYLYPGYMGTLGWAFATALGAKVANPDQPVVATCGDGGFMFTANELATAMKYGISTVTVVFDDGAYGNVQLMQRDFYGGRIHATDLTNPDFVAFAKSFGAHAELVDGGPTDLQARITAALDRPVPTVLVVPQGRWPSPWPHLANTKVR